MICVPIMVRDPALALQLASAAKAAGADLVEFRLDECFTGDAASADAEIAAIVGLVSRSPLPCIATCRPTGTEGGGYDGPDDARVSLFERLGTAFGRLKDGNAEHPPRYLDVELSTWQRSANIRQKVKLAVDHPEQIRDVSTSLILSSHDFNGRPSDLSRRLAAMREASDNGAAKVHKIAFRARSVRDNLELFDLLTSAHTPTIALGMGEFGLMSRILAPKFGGLLTFASLRKEEVTAPGQPTIAELIDLYRFRSISAQTRVFGVIGFPIGHSLSPLVHNAGFAATGFDGVYVPIPVPGGSDADAAYVNLKATLLEFIDHPRLSFCGASVTIPHKENLVRLARERGWAMDETSAAIGAANTLVVERDSADRPVSVRVANTDAPALVASLAAVGELQGRRVAVLGAGGVARAAAWGLARSGATVVVYGRTKAKAEAVVAELQASLADAGKLVAADWSLLPKSCAEIYVNATPMGMAGGPAAADSALSAEALASCSANKTGTVVLDTVYNPVDTPTLRAAREFGYRTVDGVSMFSSQAEAQFALFASSSAPAGLFDRLARERLTASVP
jgi:3-dehydroquinate dehydratase / shikimate dehydrogenase